MFALLAGLVLLTAAGARAESARALVAKGNRAYEAGKYDEALDLYEQASVTAPEAPQIYFDRAAAYYRKGDYAKAVEAWEKAGLKSKDLGLEARCKYNLGNCAFQECERQKDSDLKKALQECERSITLYQEALKLDPALADAARNIEVARLTMKAILDEIKKREDEQKQQQQAADQLKRLVERQEAALKKNQAIAADKQKPGASPDDARQKTGELGKEQRQLHADTKSFAEALQQQIQAAQQQAQQQAQAQGQQGPQPAPIPPGSDPISQHLNQAVTHQDSAAGKLQADQLDRAQPDQAAALDELKKAQEEMEKNQKPSDGQQQPQEQKGQQQDQKQGEKKPQDGQQGDQKQEQKQDQSPEQQQAQQAESKDGQDQQQQQEEAQAALADDKAHDILNEEKENRDRRDQQPAGGYRPVDKDW